MSSVEWRVGWKDSMEILLDEDVGFVAAIKKRIILENLEKCSGNLIV